MQELIERLQSLHNLNPEQSKAVLNTIKNFIVEKFPMVEGMVGNLFGDDGDEKEGDDLTGKVGGMFGK